MSHDLFSHIDGSTFKTSTTITADGGATTVNPALSPWVAKDQKIHSLLFSSLSQDVMPEIIWCDSARSIWIALETACSNSLVSCVNQLRL
ncbi:hypothetical protein ACS0TY_026540 [Phlomoides rotata]